jgi:hypothetical protein
MAVEMSTFVWWVAQSHLPSPARNRIWPRWVTCFIQCRWAWLIRLSVGPAINLTDGRPCRVYERWKLTEKMAAAPQDFRNDIKGVFNALQPWMQRESRELYPQAA